MHHKTTCKKIKIPWYKSLFLNVLFKIVKVMHKNAVKEVSELKEQGERGTPFYQKKVETERKLRDTRNKLRDTLAIVND